MLSYKKCHYMNVKLLPAGAICKATPAALNPYIVKFTV